MLGAVDSPVDHRWKVVEVLLQILQILLPVAPAYLEDSDLHIHILKHFGVLANLEGAELVNLLVRERSPIKFAQALSQLFFAFDLRVVESAVDDKSDFMRR